MTYVLRLTYRPSLSYMIAGELPLHWESRAFAVSSASGQRVAEALRSGHIKA
jgi:hypothetical protein